MTLSSRELSDRGVCVWPRCSATVEVREGDEPPGSSGNGGIEEMNRAACRGAVHRSAGARSVGLSGQEKRCSIVCGAEPQFGQAGDGALPTRWR